MLAALRGIELQERTVLWQGVEQRQERRSTSWRAASSVRTCSVTLAWIVRASACSSRWQ